MNTLINLVATVTMAASLAVGVPPVAAASGGSAAHSVSGSHDALAASAGKFIRPRPCREFRCAV